MSNPNTSSPLMRLQRWLAIAALVAHGAFIGWFYSPVASGAGSSGYLTDARVLAEGRLTMTTRSVPELGSQPWFHVVPLGRVGNGETPVLTPMYPIGLPPHLAGFSIMFSWHWGPLLVGGLPGASGLSWYQYSLHGDPTRSGYGSPWGVFGAQYFKPTMIFFGAWLSRLLHAWLLVAPLAPFLPWRSRWREIIAFVA